VTFLHAARPNGAHAWWPLDDPNPDALRILLELVAPVVPHDACWDVTETDQP